MTSLFLYLSVAAGGAVGACLRYFVSNLSIHWFGKGFPFGTLAVNVIGSFIFAIMFSLIERGVLQEAPWRTLIMVGLLGAFTTFSTFSFDTVSLMQQGAWVKSGLNVAFNIVCCLTATWLGLQIFKG